ncbi:MAG: phenylalanine--tRNA ligase subunit beta [Bacteroidota bacterium]
MKISYNWLKDFIDIPETPEVIGETLTQTGLEVEGIERVEKIPGGLEGLVVGEVMECIPHPNADKLKLTKVDAGIGELLPIVCGAPNVARGQKVVVATVGTVIHPTNGESFKITKAKIRGEVSEGMLCAEDEIGLGTSHAGLLILDTDKKNGTPVKEIFETGEDYVFEIGLTPNRGDAASHLGAARDLKAFYHRSIKIPAAPAQKTQADRPIEVIVEDFEACPRYSGATIRGVKVGPSPDWLQWRLRAVGLTPINNVVDITNYVLMSIGQPMHAFDADKIAGGKVIVKKLKDGTPFKTLDEVERKLSKDDLMICDTKEGMCIAGVFGGIDTGITESTTSVFLESAYFSSDSVRATAMRHGLSTDASFRFERGTDPEITIPALHWAVNLILEFAGGKLSSDYIDLYPNKILPKEIPTTYSNFSRLIGIEISVDRITSILNNLDIETTNFKGDHFTAIVPPYRSEVTREADLVEEVLRIYGINNVGLDGQSNAGNVVSASSDKESHKVFEELSIYLAGQGYSEIVTNSLTNPEYFEKAPISNLTPVEILNKSSQELGFMKTTPIYTALESIRYNVNRKRKNIKFFELSKTYGKKDSGKYLEQEFLTLYLSGDKHDESWFTPSKGVSIYDLSGTTYSLLEYLDIPDYSTQSSSDDRFEYGIEIVLNNHPVGVIGKLKKPILKYFEIEQEIYYAELDWKKVLKNIQREKTFREISKFPEVRRDLSLIVDKKVSFKALRDVALETERKLLNRINLFSVYEGENIGNDKKAYALSFFLQDIEKTLTDKVIDKSMDRLIQAYENKLEAIIRR